MVEELKSRAPQGQQLTLAAARRIISVIGAQNGTANTCDAASAPGDATGESLTARSASGDAVGVASTTVGLTNPSCLDTARVTKVVCYVHPTTRNVISARYDGNTGADGQVCLSCDTCERYEVVMADGEYITVMAAYKASTGLAIAGLLHITNFGQYLLCGDGVAQTSGTVAWGPKVNPGPVGAAPDNLLAVSAFAGVCALSMSKPYMQRITSVCFSKRKWG